MTKVDDKLKVLDGQHLKNVCDCLELIIDDYDDTVLNVEENQPIIDFENALEFKSLRARIERDIVSWENTATIQEAPDPEDQFIAPVNLLSIVNSNCEIYIGNNILNICDNSSGSSIINPDWNSFDLDDQTVENRTWCPFNGSATTPGCCPITQELVRATFPNNNRKRAKVSVFSYGFILPLGGLLSTHGGKITTQKQNGRGNWKRDREDIMISSSGGTPGAWQSNCIPFDTPSIARHTSHEKRKSREKTRTNIGVLNTPAWVINGNCTTASVRNIFAPFVCNSN